jgi:hypothetical protein
MAVTQQYPFMIHDAPETFNAPICQSPTKRSAVFIVSRGEENEIVEENSCEWTNGQALVNK